MSGVVSLTQPTILPLHDTRSLARKPVGLDDGNRVGRRSTSFAPIGSAPSIPRVPACPMRSTGSGTERSSAAWPRLRRVRLSQRRGPSTRARSGRSCVRKRSTASAFALVLYPKIGMLDGRHGHNAWLHELPDPVTKVTWDNYACFSPAAARQLGIADGDVVRVTAAGAPPLELPAFVQPGQHDGVVAIALGYGRAGTDRFAKVGPPWFEARPPAGLVGVNASALVTTVDSTRRYSGRAVTVVKTGRTHPLASTQIHHSLARRWKARSRRPHRAGNDAGTTDARSGAQLRRDDRRRRSVALRSSAPAGAPMGHGRSISIPAPVVRRA